MSRAASAEGEEFIAFVFEPPYGPGKSRLQVGPSLQRIVKNDNRAVARKPPHIVYNPVGRKFAAVITRDKVVHYYIVMRRDNGSLRPAH